MTTKSSAAVQTTSPAYAITALEDALRVLAIIGEHPGLKAKQIADLTDLTKSKVFRILRTLEAHDFITLDADSAAQLGPAAFVLGKRAEEQWSLARAARPILDELAESTQENVHLVVREGLHSLVVDVRISPQPIRMFAKVGRIGPLHAGGTPKVLLAFAPEHVVERALAVPLEGYTQATVQRPEELRAILAQIRRDGYHLAIADLEPDTFSLAAPVRDHTGEVIAALSIAGPLMRLDDAKRAQFTLLVVHAAEQLSRALGFRA